MKLSGLCVATFLVLWALTLHPLCLVGLGVSVLALLLAADRANQRDKLAPWRYPGGDR